MLRLNEIVATISNYQPELLENTTFTAAVMLILLHTDEEDIEIVITQRAITLPTYSGHFSLPGGMRDATDKDLYDTAQREVQEELHIIPESYRYLGQLDDVHDRYGNLVRPFVTLMEKQHFLNLVKPSPNEIAAIYYLPLSDLTTFQDTPDLHAVTNRRPSYSFIRENIFIWGLTAAILMQFLNLIQPLKKLTF